MASIILTSENSSGLAPLTYIWKNSAGTVIGTASSQVVSTADTYSLIVTDALGTISAEATHIVTENFTTPVVSITTTPSNTTKLTAGTTQITLNGSTSVGNSFRWTDGSNNQVGTNPNYIATVEGQYTLTVSDTTTGCAGSKSILITEDNIPPTAIIVTNGVINGDGEINCNISSITLNGSTSTGVNSISYQWYKDNSPYSTSQSIIVNTIGVYKLTVTDIVNGLSNSRSINVTSNTIIPLVNISALNTNITYTGQEIIMTATAGLSYLWSTAETTQTIAVTSGGVYSVTGTSINGCSASDDITITESISNLVVSITEPNSLALNCDVTSLTITASVVGDVGAVSYEWWDTVGDTLLGVGTSITLSEQGFYKVIAYDNGNSNTNTNNFTITGNSYSSPPTANISGPTKLSCLGPITLDGTGSTGIGTLTYQWKNLNTNQIVGTNSTVNISTSGLYELTVKNGLNSLCSDSTSINIADTDSLNFTIQTTSQIVSVGTPSTLSATITGTGPFTYQWTEGNASATIVGGSPQNTTTIQASTGGKYSLLITDVAGCTVTKSIILSDEVLADTQPPTAPSNLTAEQTPVLTNNVFLQWDASIDNVAVDHYRIERQLFTSPIPPLTIIDTVNHPATTYLDSSVSLNNSYTYRVSAIDTAGNLSLPSNSVMINLQSCLVKGSKILTSTGNLVLIEDLIVGDELLSVKFDDLIDTNNVDYLFKWNSPELKEIRTKSKIDIIYPFETENTIIINKGLLESTPSHIQLIKRDGMWMFNRMDNVKIGDKLYNLDGKIVEVDNIQINTEKRTAYRLTLLAPNHMYFANNILTHNAKQL